MITTMSIPEDVNSRLRLTPVIKESGILRYGLWEPLDIVLNGTESSIVVDSTSENRPDLISMEVYGVVDYWWVIMQVNNILMPIRDLVAGKILIIPFLSSIEGALARVRR